MGANLRVVGSDTEEQARLRVDLFSTRGRYLARRASQLAGVPERTVYHWASEGLLVPDHQDASPMYWSYRDLVLLRMFAWLRTRRVTPDSAGQRLRQIRMRLDQGDLPGEGVIRADHQVFLEGDQSVDEATGIALFPSMVSLVSRFDLLMPVIEGSEHWSGPNLVHPSTQTSISPWVLSGEPCIRTTRIPSSAIYALSVERGMNADDVRQLYPNVSATAFADAVGLERRLRGLQPAA